MLYVLIFLIALPCCLFGQNVVEVSYQEYGIANEEHIKKTAPAHQVELIIATTNERYQYVLQHDKGYSQYVPAYPDIPDKEIETKIGLLRISKNGYRNSLIIKDFNNRQMAYRRIKSVIKDNFHDFEWQLYDSTKTILAHPCKLAFGSDYVTNRKIRVWYTEEIPISDGPKFYQGLPGLVLEVQMENNLFVVATKISFPESIPDFEALQSEKAISLEEYMEQQEKAMEKMKRMMQSKTDN
ncbi:MAG: GLPGLI family protein [Bernardetiaceae bacterium]